MSARDRVLEGFEDIFDGIGATEEAAQEPPGQAAQDPPEQREMYQAQVMSDQWWEKRITPQLSAPFPPDLTHFRIGQTSGDRGSVLAYIDARDVMDRLDEVVGSGNWVNVYTVVGQGSGQTTVCQLSIWDPHLERWVSKQDGAGATGFEAEKGQLSDAFKRSAVHFGVGRYLYGLDSPWVDIEKRGRSAFIPEHELDRLHQWLDKVLKGQRVGLPTKEAPPPDPEEEAQERTQEVAKRQKPVDARQPSGRPITMRQAGRFMAIAIEHGEKVDMRGFEVLQLALEACGLETARGKQTGQSFKEHLTHQVGMDDADEFEAAIAAVESPI